MSLAMSPINIESGVFKQIQRIFQGANLPVDQWYVRLGSEADIAAPNGHRKTVIPIRHGEVHASDLMHVEPATGVAIVIDPKSLRRYDGTVITENGPFLNALKQSVEVRKRRDEAMDTFAQENHLEGYVMVHGERVLARSLVEYCPEHKIAYDKRTGCPQCRAPKVEHEVLTNDEIRATNEAGRFFNADPKTKAEILERKKLAEAPRR